MSRPKSKYLDLPPNVTARSSGGRLLYYFNTGGKKLPLGSDRTKACYLAERIRNGETFKGSGNFCRTNFSEVGFSNYSVLLTEEEILEKAIDANKRPGVYFLVRNGRVVYVGQSTDVFKRIVDHKMQKKLFDSFFWIPCPASMLRELEQVYIEKLDPLHNVLRPTNQIENWQRSFPAFKNRSVEKIHN